jgi:methionine-rich copper-binding protein CopC
MTSGSSRTHRSQLKNAVAAALVALIAVFSVSFFVTPALAHSELEESMPAQGESVSTLSELMLTFGEEVVPEFSKYTLVDSMGMTVALGEPKYDVTKTTVTIPVTGEIMAADYVIGYAVLSIDGHPISGKVNFTSTAAGPSPTTSPTNTSTPTPSPSGDSTLAANIGYAATGLVSGAIVVAVITVIMRRRKKV